MMIPLPTSADVGQIEAWVTSGPVRVLVETFGGIWPQGDLGEVLAQLDVFTQDVWDFRDGRERHLSHRPEFDEATAALIVEQTRALGLVEETPPKRTKYTHLLILGGLIRACAQRPAHAARLLDGGLDVPEIEALGSHRPLYDLEKEVGLRLGLGAVDTEMDAMDAGIRKAFGLGAPDSATEHVRTYRADGRILRSIAAPSADPERRADTADTYRYWATFRRLGPEDRLLLVTSTAYVPAQHCVALRVLGHTYGCEVETVGLAPEVLPFTPANYLQEVRSALRALRDLYAVATA